MQHRKVLEQQHTHQQMTCSRTIPHAETRLSHSCGPRASELRPSHLVYPVFIPWRHLWLFVKYRYGTVGKTKETLVKYDDLLTKSKFAHHVHISVHKTRYSNNYQQQWPDLFIDPGGYAGILKGSTRCGINQQLINLYRTVRTIN